MQVRAIAGAAAELKKQGLNPQPEIMIPLVAFESEIETLRATAEEVVAEVAKEEGVGSTSRSAP